MAQQVPGVYHRRLGDWLVTALSDGFVQMDYDVFREFPREEVDAIMAIDHRRSPPRVSVNAFLLRKPGMTVLFDTGSQDKMGETCGRLFDNLAVAGCRPEDVDYICLTHIHPDHSCGLTDPASGRRLFPNARVIVNRKEFEHWFSDEEMAKADERKKLRYFSWGREQVGPYIRDHLDLVEDGQEVLPGISLAECAGHTPGHSAYVIGSQGQEMVIWGDLTHVPEIQLARPQVAMSFDHDPVLAVRTRIALLAVVAERDMLVAGMHLHFPGFGWLLPSGTGYRVVADQWAFEV